MTTIYRLQFKPTKSTRTWRNASLSMKDLEAMRLAARELRDQENWHGVQILDDSGFIHWGLNRV